MNAGPGLREASRRLAQSEIAAAAEALFIAQGFEETTVDAIAAEVGMSQRSFFRYFASKDDVVLDRLERLGDDLVDHLGSCPGDEPAWDTLHQAFGLIVEQYGDREHRERSAAIQRIIEDSPRLLAAYLQRLDSVQQRLTDHLNARASGRGRRPDPVVLRAMVGAAFACLHAAICHVVNEGDPEQFGRHLDRAMIALRPASAPQVPLAR